MNVRSEQKQEAKSELSDPGDRNESMLLHMRRQVEEIERLKNSPGSESETVLDSILEIVKEMISVYSEYESAMVKVFAALEFNAIDSLDGIRKSIDMADQAEVATNRMEQLDKEMNTKLKESLAGNQVPASDADSTIRSFYLTVYIEGKSELYKMNAEIIKDAQSALQIMEKEWGAWEYNVEGGGVLFESENTVIEFKSIMERIGVLVSKVKALQHSILKAQTGDSG